ncbi:hypothetical protein MJO28_012263 [Puccinia striiformis f. sp. tritici]|uniref:Uncharacterized protein n=1 Tax=Puccinia striiformis f. sp. tritici TaxID=168172 RepID=A0ACC0E0N2_9BASI|nr:hypothetical protein MJO28_012263 [Puccinia striiformis f. sp. tritici]
MNDDYPALEPATGSQNQNQNQTEAAHEGGELSSAEKLMRAHHQHLSYEEIQTNNTNGHQSSLTNGSTNNNKKKKQQPDLDSETAFPALGTPAAAPKTAGGWGAGPALSSRTLAGSFQKADLSNTNQFTETLVLLLSSIHIGPVPPQYREKGPRAAGEKRDEDPKTLPDVLRVIQKRHPTVIVESSTSRDRVTIIFRTPFVLPVPTSSTPTLIRSASNLAPEERIVRARQELITRVTRKIEKVIKIPVSVKPFIIGQRGRVMKEIIEITGANISLPPKIDSTTPTSNEELVNGSDDIEMMTITINGEESSVLDAEDKIMMIVREHTNKVTHKITSIPYESYPLLQKNSNPKIEEVIVNGLINELGIQEDLINCQLNIPSADQIFNSTPSHLCLANDLENHKTPSSSIIPSKESLPITISGDREQVEYAIKVIESAFQNMMKSITKVELELPKRQHKFLDNLAISEILESTGSLVILPAPTDLSEKVVIRGDNMSNVQALGLVVTKANAMKVESIDLNKIHSKLTDPTGYTNAVIRYLSSKVNQTKLKQIQEENKSSGVKIYIPLKSSTFSTIDIAGDKPESIKKVKGLVETWILNSLKPEYFLIIDEVDKLLFRQILKKKNPRLKVILDHNGIEMLIPNNEQDQSTTILLVASKPILINNKELKTNEQEWLNGLTKAKEEILKSVQELSEIKTLELEIPSTLHDQIKGPNQTTLNVIIGEDKLVSVHFGSTTSADTVSIRGPKDEVDRVQKEIKRVAEEAKVSETINSYSTEFEIDSKLVSHLVGKGGATITKLGEELGVKVTFVDQPSTNNNSNGTPATNSFHEDNNRIDNHHKKRKNNSHLKVLVSITGRLENVEEAKKRILNQAERLADEVTVTLPISAGLDRGALIGKGGIYLTRLQDTHMVHINMPRSRKEDATSANGNDSDITIRGPRKGVEAVKRELIELMEYEREQGNVVTMEISTKSVSRIVGKGGVQASQIKEDSGLQSLDIDRLDNTEGTSRVTLKGSKAAISAAKKLIVGIVQSVDDECSVEVKIPQVYHQELIRRGGARLRELVKKAGVDESASKLVHFPKSNAASEVADIVRIHGDKTTVPKIQRELELEVERLMNQVTYGIYVPKNSQPGIIGRAASGIKTLQDKFNVTIIAPGWSQWATSDIPFNQSTDLKDINPDEIFKIIGSKEACLSAIDDLKTKIVIKDRPERTPSSQKTISIPAQYHHILNQNGRFVRGLPRGVKIDHGSLKIPTLDQLGNDDQITSTSEANSNPTPQPASRIDVEDHDNNDSYNQNNQPVILSWSSAAVKINGISEVPWNITGPEGEITKVEKMISRQLDFWTNKVTTEGELNVVTVKVPVHVMPGIIGRGGTGLRELIAKSEGAFVEVLGKSGSDTLKIIGTHIQLDIIKNFLNGMRRSRA